MRRSFLAVVAVVLAGCGPELGGPIDGEDTLDTRSSELSSNRASVWFPMGAGNTWTLAATSPNTLPATRTVWLTLTQGDTLARLVGLTPTHQWIGVDTSASTTLNIRSTTSAAWAPFIRFGYAVTPWAWGSGACGTFTAHRIATGDSIETDAGKFTDVRTIRFDLKPAANVRCATPAFQDLSFAPGVGLVALTTAAGDRYLLKSARVGAAQYPVDAASALIGTLTSDAAVYTNKPDTIVCITTPCPSNEVTATATFSFKVKNTASVAVGINTIGCLHNIELLDGTGAVIKSINEARFCDPNTHSTVFAPGETKVYGGTLELKAGTTQLLGNLTARAYLSQRSPSGPVATDTVAIKVKAP